MIYCEGVECTTELGNKLQRFRSDRPDEWTMDVIIGEVERVVGEKDATIEQQTKRIEELEARVATRESGFGFAMDNTE